MTHTRALISVALGLVLSTYTLQAEELARYRDFQLGGDLATVSALAGVAASQAKTIHRRPAVIQELEWRPPYFVRDSIATKNDPVRLIVFSFYDDQLFTMVVDYDPSRTAGMTDTDMIEAISTEYGPPLQPALQKTRTVASQVEQGAAVARWGDADHSVALYRSSYASGFRLVVSALPLEALARTAKAQALRLDEREAPQREIARQKREEEDTRAALEKARTANKASFRP